MYKISLIMKYFISAIICLIILSHFEIENVTLIEDSKIENTTEDYLKLSKSQISESVPRGV